MQDFLMMRMLKRSRESNLEPLPNYPAPSKQDCVDWYISFVTCKLRVLLFYTMQSNTSWYPNIKIVWTIPHNLSSRSTWQSRVTQGSPANNDGQIRDKNNHDRCPSLLYYSLHHSYQPNDVPRVKHFLSWDSWRSLIHKKFQWLPESGTTAPNFIFWTTK